MPETQTTKKLIDCLKWFSPISLDQLNSSMSFLERVDVKYLVHASELQDIISRLQDSFYVLSIKDNSIFHYDNVYMDTKEYDFYYQHEDGTTPRTKIRTRHYIESDIAFFEFKQKEKRVTRKFRYQCDVSEHGMMSNESIRFYSGVYQSMNSAAPTHIIFPAMGTRYQRFTLCSKNNDERLTIDFNIHLYDTRNPEKAPIHLKNLAIIESKSNSTDCLSHHVLKELGIEEAKSCSKYCLGMYYHHVASRWSVFQHSINTIEAIRKARRWKTKKTIKALSELTPTSDKQELVHSTPLLSEYPEVPDKH
jgi:hypothetical protein